MNTLILSSSKYQYRYIPEQKLQYRDKELWYRFMFRINGLTIYLIKISCQRKIENE